MYGAEGASAASQGGLVFGVGQALLSLLAISLLVLVTSGMPDVAAAFGMALALCLL